MIKLYPDNVADSLYGCIRRIREGAKAMERAIEIVKNAIKIDYPYNEAFLEAKVKTAEGLYGLSVIHELLDSAEPNSWDRLCGLEQIAESLEEGIAAAIDEEDAATADEKYCRKRTGPKIGGTE